MNFFNDKKEVAQMRKMIVKLQDKGSKLHYNGMRLHILQPRDERCSYLIMEV